jgi:leucyl/phenylalanyl-tRNA--protein transferase
VPWEFPPADSADEDGIVGIGADLEPETLLIAYRSGLFPMPVRAGAQEVLAWWSPDPRAILPLDGLRISRSLRRSCARYIVTIDMAFPAVIDACADPDRPSGWINAAIRDAYVRLHELGIAHSVEAWDTDGSLAGGLYGVAIGGLFAGESMFHHRTDASKVALVSLVSALRSNERGMLDVQWLTPHLASLGAIELPRTEYLRRLRDALDAPLPSVFSR